MEFLKAFFLGLSIIGMVLIFVAWILSLIRFEIKEISWKPFLIRVSHPGKTKQMALLGVALI